jgi:spore maturation protein SpmA
MMNWIWLGLVVGSIVCAGFTGKIPALTEGSFLAAKDAVKLAIDLIGVMALWLGIMRVAQEAGLMRIIARALRRPMGWLFPDIPAEHPAMSAMIMNIGANLMGLGNAATPFGIKAMVELNKLNAAPGVATNAMCLFLAINPSHLALIPTGVMGLRAITGSTDPAAIWLPTILSSLCAMVVAIVTARALGRANFFRVQKYLAEEGAEKQTPAAKPPEAPPEPDVLGSDRKAGLGPRLFCYLSIAAILTSLVYYYVGWWSRPTPTDPAAAAGGLGMLKDLFSSWAIPGLMAGFLLYGVAKGVRVYETLVEGAKEGFQVAIRIIPYMVAIFVAVRMVTDSGAMELLKSLGGASGRLAGVPAEALPMVLIRPLSGNGAYAYMSSVFQNPGLGPDSFVGQMLSIMQGSTETTFYVLAVYFGAVQVYKVRHAVAVGLLADLAGVIAAVLMTYLFFA